MENQFSVYGKDFGSGFKDFKTINPLKYFQRFILETAETNLYSKTFHRGGTDKKWNGPLLVLGI